ncbi:MAG: cell division protein ZipA [Gammaproteobacteria bacterium]|nr:cell division protein ZipA [Gammaproteobacteria bacterium]
MDELRWILLAGGLVLVAAIYFTGRARREDWKRTRSTPRDGLQKRSSVQEQNTARGEGAPQGRVQPRQPSHTDKSRREPRFKTAEPLEDVVVEAGPTEGDTPTISPPMVSDVTPLAENVEEGTANSVTSEDLAAKVEVTASAHSSFNISPEPEPKAATTGFPRLDIEPLVLVLTVMSRDNDTFPGEQIRAALEAEGLMHGDMHIFHYLVDGAADAVFSVASVLEPGTFDLEILASFRTTGLSLFCQLPGPLSPASTYAVMLAKAEAVASALNGELCDDKRNRLSAQERQHYEERVTEFSRKLVLASRQAARDR